MQKRKIIFNTYDTAVDGLWTLVAWSLGDAEPEELLVDIPGRIDGPIDAAEALTGDVQYRPRSLEVLLESSEGTRLERKARIDYLVNSLHGRRVQIWLPDDAEHYVVGRLKVKPQYNDLAHAAVQVTATCEPWRYANEETVVAVELNDSKVHNVTLGGTRRQTYPTIQVSSSITLGYNGKSRMLSAGTYLLPDIQLSQGETSLSVSGSGSVVFTYRKAVL